MELNKGARVIEIALKLGYDHPQNFTVAFDKWFGSTPSSMRMNAEPTIDLTFDNFVGCRLET